MYLYNWHTYAVSLHMKTHMILILSTFPARVKHDMTVFQKWRCSVGSNTEELKRMWLLFKKTKSLSTCVCLFCKMNGRGRGGWYSEENIYHMHQKVVVKTNGVTGSYVSSCVIDGTKESMGATLTWSWEWRELGGSDEEADFVISKQALCALWEVTTYTMRHCAVGAHWPWEERWRQWRQMANWFEGRRKMFGFEMCKSQ